MGWSVVGVFVLLIAGVAWVGIRGWQAKGELEAAIPLAAQIQDQFAAGEVDAATASSRALVDHAESAASLTGDPIWRVFEIIPGVGANLTAFREAAEVTNSVSSGAVFPLVSNVSDIGVDSFKPVNGSIDLQPLIDAAPTVSSARTVLSAAADKARAISTDGTIAPVSEAIGKLQSSVIKANDLIQGVDRAATLVPRMLGADGDRSYVLLFQNPAELRSGGGITSALAQVTTSNGSVSLARQASATEFPQYDMPVVPLPPETQQLFGTRAATYIQNTTLVPQFEMSGQIAAQMWTNQFGSTVDGVISFDPVALGYLLDATGPITLPTTGYELTSDNAVQFLLSNVYSLYEDPTVQDLVFAEAAQAVFNAVSAGNLDPVKLLDALGKAGDEGRFKVWSAHQDDQAILADTTLAGGLPVSDPGETGIAVYFNDATGAKMDFYLDTAVNIESAECRADGRPVIRASVTLTSTAPADAGITLPDYVTGAGIYGVTPGNVKTIVYVYGPDGSGDVDNPVLITNINPGAEVGESFSARDESRIVAGFPVELAPGESRTMTVDFLAQPGTSADVTTEITPTVHPTVYSTEINRALPDCEIR